MKYVALFRGINVGGKNIVKMNELVQLLLDLGLTKVKTYIQSGNAVFEAAQDEESLRTLIQTGFREHFKFECNVLLRSIDDISLLIKQLPFQAEEIAAAEAADSQVEHLYVYFLEQPPEQAQIASIYRSDVGPDLMHPGEREIYLLCHQSIRKSKLAISASKVFASSTVRNWKTVKQLYDMLNSL